MSDTSSQLRTLYHQYILFLNMGMSPYFPQKPKDVILFSFSILQEHVLKYSIGPQYDPAYLPIRLSGL